MKKQNIAEIKASHLGLDPKSHKKQKDSFCLCCVQMGKQAGAKSEREKWENEIRVILIMFSSNEIAEDDVIANIRKRLESILQKPADAENKGE